MRFKLTLNALRRGVKLNPPIQVSPEIIVLIKMHFAFSVRLKNNVAGSKQWLLIKPDLFPAVEEGVLTTH